MKAICFAVLLLAVIAVPSWAVTNWVEVTFDPGFYQIEYPDDASRLPSGAFRLTATMEFPGSVLGVSAWVGYYNPPRKTIDNPMPQPQPAWGAWNYSAQPLRRGPRVLRAEQDPIMGTITHYVDGTKVGSVRGPAGLARPQRFEMGVAHGPGNAWVGDMSSAGPPTPTIHYCFMRQTIQSVSIGWIGEDGSQKTKTETFAPGVESRWDSSDFTIHMDRLRFGTGLTIETTAFGKAPADTGHCLAGEWERPDLYPGGLRAFIATSLLPE